jgi:hypothetical protein
MKVTGETFSFIKKGKRAKEARCKSIQTFRQKDRYRTELWRDSIEAPKGQFLTIREILAEFDSRSSPLILSNIRQLGRSYIFKNYVV